MLATQIISRVLNTLHVEVPIRALFETPTVADMAAVITQCQAEQVEHGEMTHILILAGVGGLLEEEVQRRLAGESKYE